MPDAQLLVVGDGDQRPACEALVDELDLRDTVRFLGTRRDVPRLLAGADVFAFASATESFGLVVAEAMAARLAGRRLPACRRWPASPPTRSPASSPTRTTTRASPRTWPTCWRDREQARKLGAAG